ncbi:MAG: iron chelate uptake ABC transporter family permease subunit [Pseudomonadota bacterium]
MLYDARADWSFLLPHRGTKLLALILVGSAIATATLLFQTITQNRILTPSIMGFDALYILLLTSIVFFLGSQTYFAFGPVAQFTVTLVVLTGSSLLLFGGILGRSAGNLIEMVLTGVILATLFRGLTSFMARLIDPNDYLVLQSVSFAQFNRIDTDLLFIAAVLSIITMARAWQIRHRLDVLALGRVPSINLGEDPKHGQLEVLALISVLVSVSTALVGPIAFLGLLVVNATYLLLPVLQHAVLLPGAALVASIVLVSGQFAMERVFAFSTPLLTVIDFLGGLVFLWLILRGVMR